MLDIISTTLFFFFFFFHIAQRPNQCWNFSHYIEEEGSYNIYIEYNAAIRNSDISYIYRWE